MNSINLENTYTSLPPEFFRYTKAETMPDVKLIKTNEQLADLLDIDISFLKSQNGLRFLSGKNAENLPKSISLAYAGHQFGHLVPQLGDGRAVLLGDKICKDGVRRDIQLKGSGKTYFSRGGDGRAGIGPVIREYLMSESMHYLGVPTTRSLAVLLTGEKVVREEVSPGAMLARVATSHVRVGTFEFFAIRNQKDNVRKLADFMIERSHPDLSEKKKKYELFFERIVTGQASLVAQWNSVGFIHGVMNTDNTSISYETIDYGPCAFMDAYEANKVFSSIDQFGRYAFSNQPPITKWNLARFAECLVPLIDKSEDYAIKLATDLIDNFQNIYEDKWLIMMRNKLGLFGEDKKDKKLINDLLDWMEKHKADYTNTFCHLMGINFDEVYNNNDFNKWKNQWKKRLELNNSTKENQIKLMRENNPIVIPRNHKVEEALTAAEKGSLDEMKKLLAILKNPYDNHTNIEEYQLPAPTSNEKYQTFCGT